MARRPLAAVADVDRAITDSFSGALVDQPETGHNRWHPDIPPTASVQPGETITFRTRDGNDGQITRTTVGEDLEGLVIGRSHPMAGPYYVVGAEPGDQLRATVVEIVPDDFGWTMILPKRFGYLKDEFEEPLVVRWEQEDGFATSVDLPGVRVPAAPFLGLMGTAPSHAGLAGYLAEEAALAATGATVGLPDPSSAIPSGGRPATEGLRTVPPREVGGNFDIKELGVGATVVLPVEVEGALFSAGDMHYSQGDGESCGTAIETTGWASVRLELVKAGDVAWRGRFPHFEFTARGRPYVATIGLSRAADGSLTDMDINAAVRQSLLEMASYLMAVHGMSSGQAHVLTSAVVDLRLSSIVNFPNIVVSACLPIDVIA
jgi:formamidase